MRSLYLILTGVAIPLILTAAVFAIPFGGGIGTSNQQWKDDVTNVLDGSTTIFSGAFQATTSAGTTTIPVAQALSANTHQITLSAESFSNGLLGYKMVSHTIITSDSDPVVDVTNRYSTEASIPGPTIVITEGDEVFLTIQNNLGSGIASVHVHGVHYDIHSDGTLMHVNGMMDEGATPFETYTYHWIAGPGTAGTWPYHDHTFGGINGAEHKGLFGTLIVNPADGEISAAGGNEIESIGVADLDKQFVLYLGDDAFWGMEIDSDGSQTPLWVNPTLRAADGDYVRFHLIALGTDAVHTFKLGSYKWLDPGTDNLINSKDIGPLENHAFTVKAEQGNSLYMDNNVSNKLMGMKGMFRVTSSGGDSTPGPSPPL